MTAFMLARVLGDGACEWELLAPGQVPGTPVAGGIAELAAACGSHELHLLLDGRSVVTCPAVIPARNQRQAALAAPYAVEDEVTDDLDTLQVSCGPPEEDGMRSVGIVDKASLEHLLSPLAQGGVVVGSIRPDYLALPFTAGHWTVLVVAGRVLVRTRRHGGFAVDAELAEAVFARLLREQPPAGLVLCGREPLPGVLSGLPCTAVEGAAAAWAVLAAGSQQKVALDLLPESFPRPRRGQRRPLAWAAGLAGLALLFHTGFLLTTNARLSGRMAELRALQGTLMREAFPEIPRVVNAEIQATQAVATLRAGSRSSPAALEILYALGRAMGEESPRLRLLGLNFADGAMSVRILSPDIGSLDQLAADPATGLLIELMSVENRPDGVVGNLQIRTRGRAG